MSKALVKNFAVATVAVVVGLFLYDMIQGKMANSEGGE